MKIWIGPVLLVIGLLVVFGVDTNRDAATSTVTEAGQAVKTDGNRRTPVIVELFTSEGCSSCPPADDVLARLDKTQPVPGAEIIALSEHVDYWNRLGWADPYSSAQFSARQSKYAQTFGNDDIYTPQMIVDGQIEFVGSNMGKALDAITRAARSPKATVQVTPVGSQAEAKDGAIQLRVQVENCPQVSAGDVAEVMLAVTENDLRSNVARGENAGRKLSHSAVVRKLISIGSVDSQGGNAFTAEPNVLLDRGWKRDRLRAVVFVQERASRRILGAAVISLAGIR